MRIVDCAIAPNDGTTQRGGTRCGINLRREATSLRTRSARHPIRRPRRTTPSGQFASARSRSEVMGRRLPKPRATPIPRPAPKATPRRQPRDVHPPSACHGRHGITARTIPQTARPGATMPPTRPSIAPMAVRCRNVDRANRGRVSMTCPRRSIIQAARRDPTLNATNAAGTLQCPRRKRRRTIRRWDGS